MPLWPDSSRYRETSELISIIRRALEVCFWGGEQKAFVARAQGCLHLKDVRCDFYSIAHAHLQSARSTLLMPHHSTALHNNIIRGTDAFCMHNRPLLSQRIHKLPFVRCSCGKHVTEMASETESPSSSSLFQPASLVNIKEADTGARCRTQSVKPSRMRSLLCVQENTEICLQLWLPLLRCVSSLLSQSMAHPSPKLLARRNHSQRCSLLGDVFFCDQQTRCSVCFYANVCPILY